VKIRLLMLGKTRRPEMRVVLEDYVKRIGHQSPIEVTEVRDGEAAAKKLDADRAATVMLLDANGKRFSSEAFAKWIGDQRDRGTR
jgi:23S rRNA pseudoU1915 N3-methylase RlmH